MDRIRTTATETRGNRTDDPGSYCRRLYRVPGDVRNHLCTLWPHHRSACGGTDR